MRYAVFSDIHGNEKAFLAVIEMAERKGADSFVFLGDVVGYGASPNECLLLLKRRANITLGGNHDYAVAGKISSHYFNRYARAAVSWTRDLISKESLQYLGSLPVIGSNDDFTYTHSSPFEPESWHYVSSVIDAKRNFHYFSGQVCFLGHSHYPVIIEKGEDGTLTGVRDKKVILKESSRYIINDGSVGQPRDGNPEASFCLFDSEERSVEIIRVAYDIKCEQEKIIKSGLPSFLAERLAVGR